jgi:hypothetical protein
MPRKMIFAAWDDLFPDRKQRVLHPHTPIDHPFVEIPYVRTSIGDFDNSRNEDEVLERFCRPLAKRFVVSPITMRIRLEKLGLLHREIPLQWLLADGS